MNYTVGQKLSRILFLACVFATVLMDFLVWRPG